MEKKLKEARKYLRLSQEFVASQLQISVPAIHAIETGKKNVTKEELAGFANLYGVDADALLQDSLSGRSETDRFSHIVADLSDADRKAVMSLVQFRNRISSF